MEKVLDGLRDDYKSIVGAVNARDSAISFEELHEKLLDKETSLNQSQPPPSLLPPTTNPTIANPTTLKNCQWHPILPLNLSTTSRNIYSSSQNFHFEGPPPRPYFSTSQAFNTQGHIAKRCPLFRLISSQSNQDFRPSGQHSIGPQSHALWQP